MQLKIAQWKMLQSMKTAGFNPPTPVPLSLSSCRWQYSAIWLQTILSIWYIWTKLYIQLFVCWIHDVISGTERMNTISKINRLSFTTILLSGTGLCWIKNWLFFLFYISHEGSTRGLGLKTSSSFKICDQI